MVGLGEVEEEITRRCATSRDHDVTSLTIGQLPQTVGEPTANEPLLHTQRVRGTEKYGIALGFRHVESGPLVRSSYHAHEQTADARKSPAAGVAGV